MRARGMGFSVVRMLILAFIVAGVSSVVGVGSLFAQPQPQAGAEAIDSLACDDDDMIVHVISDLAPKGGLSLTSAPVPGSDESALAAFLEQAYDGIAPSSFAAATRGNNVSQFVLGGDRRQASAYVVRSGLSWHVAEFVACNKFVQPRSRATQP